MKKRIIFFFLLFGLSIAIAYPVHASKLKVKTAKNVTIRVGGEKTKKIKIYFKGVNVSDSCEIKVKGGNKGAISVDEYSGEYDIYANKLKKKKTRIKFIIEFCPLVYEMEHEKEDDTEDNGDWDEKYHTSFGILSEAQFYKTYKITKTVTIKKKYSKKLSIGEELIEYYTRSNKFKAYIQNKSKKTITIMGYGSKAIDVDYKSYDRNLKTKKGRSIKIKPGQRKKIYFYVQGPTTWPNVNDFYLKVKIKYRGKIYTRIVT